MVEQTQRVEVIAVDTPEGEFDDTGGGVSISIRPVNVVVGTGHTGVDCNVVGEALTFVLKDVVEGMYVR